MRAAATTTAALVLVVSLGGCADTAGERDTYRESAAAALEAVLGDARTAELAGRTWLRERSTGAFTRVVVRASEQGAGSEAAWFSALQPPTRADDPLRERTTGLIEDAVGAIEHLRVAVERSDEAAARTALAEVGGAAADLEGLAGDLG